MRKDRKGEVMKGVTVKQLIAGLRRMPQDAPVVFLNIDDPGYAAVTVEDVAVVIEKAGLKKGQVVISGS